MTPKEKAVELVEKFKQFADSQLTYDSFEQDKETLLKNSKQCAIICVDEILKESEEQYEYWQQVKEEIQLP